MVSAVGRARELMICALPSCVRATHASTHAKVCAMVEAEVGASEKVPERVAACDAKSMERFRVGAEKCGCNGWLSSIEKKSMRTWKRKG